MRPDSEIKHDVEQELRSDPAIDATDIAVAVREGIVSLTGFVRSYRQRRGATLAAKRVAGVVGVVNDIDVRLPILHQRPDPQIAREAVEAIRRVLPDAAEHIRVIVRDGWVVLEGEVNWNYEREEAFWQVDSVPGVIDIENHIRLRSSADPTDVRAEIAKAFSRNALIDAKGIEVEVNGSEVKLKGVVKSWVEREEAQRAAWSVPGVTWVENQISVVP